MALTPEDIVLPQDVMDQAKQAVEGVSEQIALTPSQLCNESARVSLVQGVANQYNCGAGRG